MGLFMKGPAWNWFLGTSPEVRSDWEAMATAFLEQYENEKFRFVRLNQLMTLDMARTETVGQYATKLKSLASALNISDAEKLAYFLRGLIPSTRCRKHIRMPWIQQSCMNIQKYCSPIMSMLW